MKTINLFILFILISFVGIKGQKPIVVSEDSIMIGNGMLPGLSVYIPEVDYEKTLKSWTKLLQTGTKSQVVTENAEMTIFGAILKDVIESPVNVYSLLIDRDSALYLAAAFELKKDQYIERATGEAEVAKAKSLLFDFAKEQYLDLVSGEVKIEENKLRDLEKEIGSLERDQSGMEKSIRSSNRTIDNEREKLISLNSELTAITSSIADERILYTSMEEGTLKDEKNDFIKELEKKKKKLTRSIESSNKKISKADRTITKATNDIPRNDRIQGKYRDELAAQEAVVQKYVDKLNTIKGYK